MILRRGDLLPEFFPQPDLDPVTSWFNRCFRLDDVRAFLNAMLADGVPEKTTGTRAAGRYGRMAR